MKKQLPIFSVKLLKTTIFVLLICSPRIVFSQIAPLPNAFAHNDYCHQHPLFDALANGYTNIEADVFLEDDELIIAHVNPFFRSGKTLESLYLQPLAARILKNNGRVYKDYAEPVILMIDIKTGAGNTYKAIEQVLDKYRFMLTSYDGGVVHNGAVTVVISGHKPYKLLKSQGKRLAFIDEDLQRTTRDTGAVNVYTMSSCKYSKLLKWSGAGIISAQEQQRLCYYVTMAHRFGKKVRLWASPENSMVWNELLKCGVDLINTDKLATLKNYLTAQAVNRADAITMVPVPDKKTISN